MALWVLKANGNVVPRRTSRPLKVEEKHSEQELAKRKVFDRLIERRWGTAINAPNTSDDQDDNNLEKYEDNEEEPKRGTRNVERGT